jgi:biotin carboxylase
LELAGKRVLIVATTTGYQIRSFGEAAERLGLRLVFASDRCDRLEDPWWDQAIPVRFHEEARSVEAVLAACAAARVDAVVAVGDRPAVLAARIARALGLPGHPPEATVVSRNKLATRQALQSAGLPTPVFFAVPVDGDPAGVAPRVRYPAVIKPLALSGSRGVVRVDSDGDLAAAFDRLQHLLRARDVRIERDEVHGQALVESFVPGIEYAVEGILHHGTLQPLAVIDKPDPLDGPFFEETIYRMPSVAPTELQKQIIAAVSAACAAIGLYHGPVHAECRVENSADLQSSVHLQSPRVYVLEVAARPIGGLCSRALRFHTPREAVSLEEVLLRHALGEDVSCYAREDAASGVMMIPIPRRGVYRRVEGLDEATAVRGIEEIRITAKPDTLLVPLPEGKSYLGFIFARGREPHEVDRALREAHARLHFVVERELAVL